MTNCTYNNKKITSNVTKYRRNYYCLT